MEARSSPLCLELCCVCLWLCQRGTIAVLISLTEQQCNSRDGSQGFPSGRRTGAPFSQGSCTAASSCSGGNVHRPETSTNHPNHGKQVVSVASHADRALHFEFVLLNSFYCSNPLSTWLCICSLCRESCHQETCAVHNQSSSSSNSLPCKA